ncbi:hypothetical protein VN97_g1707 [Penicillium thymicola]|uniref:Uncharacterized protein n=1 Tax=Penicillium thymicola TaxID=293382 RepID=A0AAI9TRS4_PENTH|nr:hypothetical protein VN97_g1707 [Penicillium thymicola]
MPLSIEHATHIENIYRTNCLHRLPNDTKITPLHVDQNHGLHDEYRAYVTPSGMWRAPIVVHFRLHRDSIQSQPITST